MIQFQGVKQVRGKMIRAHKVTHESEEQVFEIAEFLTERQATKLDERVKAVFTKAFD